MEMVFLALRVSFHSILPQFSPDTNSKHLEWSGTSRPCAHLLSIEYRSTKSRKEGRNTKEHRLRWHDSANHRMCSVVSSPSSRLHYLVLYSLLVPSLVALQSGGQSHPWSSAYVLCQFFIGLALLIALVLWEWKGAENPVIPFRLFTGQRVVGFIFIIAFVAGIDYYVILTIGPEVLIEVFDPSPVITGLYGLGPSLCLVAGATIINVLLTVFRGRARELLFVCAVVMSKLAFNKFHERSALISSPSCIHWCSSRYRSQSPCQNSRSKLFCLIWRWWSYRADVNHRHHGLVLYTLSKNLLS